MSRAVEQNDDAIGVPSPETPESTAGAGQSAARRQDDIVDLVQRRSLVRVEELVSLLGVSRMTVHRDLAALTDQGRVLRVRGGVRKAAPKLAEADLRVRRSLRTTVKKALAARAAALVADGDVIALDDSSTVAEMMDYLLPRRDLTVITHSLALMREVANLGERASLIGLGGDYYAQTDSFLGLGVARQAAELRADTVFVAITALRGGLLYHPDYEAGITKRTLLGIADRKVLLLDATRFEGHGLYQVAPLSIFDDVIVDQAAGSERIAELSRHTAARIEVVEIP